MAGLILFPINTIHYILSELWGTISVSFLLWGYVNSITPRAAAKRYYGVLGLGAQAGPIAAGKLVDHIGEMMGKGDAAFAKTIKYLNAVSLVFMALFAAGYAFMQLYVMKLPQFVDSAADGAKNKKKKKMGIMESIKYCVGNPYVLALGGMVFAYGWCMVVGELAYKEVMKLAKNGDPNGYSQMKGIESMSSSICAAFLMVFVSHNIIRLCGWKVR